MNPMTNVKNIKKLSEEELKGRNKSSWHEQYRSSAWIFVGGLPYELTEGDLICVFSQYGEPVNINLVRDKESGKSKGFGFICYEDQRSTDLAVDNFNGIKLLGRTIRVDHVENYKPPKHSKDEKALEMTSAIVKNNKEKVDIQEKSIDKVKVKQEKISSDELSDADEVDKLKKKKRVKKKTKKKWNSDDNKKKRNKMSKDLKRGKKKKKKKDENSSESESEVTKKKGKKRKKTSDDSSSSSSDTSSSDDSSSSSNESDSSSSSSSDDSSDKISPESKKRNRTIEDLKREAKLIQEELKRRQKADEEAKKLQRTLDDKERKKDANKRSRSESKDRERRRGHSRDRRHDREERKKRDRSKSPPKRNDKHRERSRSPTRSSRRRSRSPHRHRENGHHQRRHH